MLKEPITDEERERFLAHLREHPNASRAARLLGRSYSGFNKLRATLPEFDVAWKEALDEGIAAAEAEVHRRAFEGVNEPLTHQGQLTYERDFAAVDLVTGDPLPPHLCPFKRDANGNLIPVTLNKRSDTLAMFMLKAYRPDTYRERQDINLTGNVDVALRITEARKRHGGV